MAWHAWRASRRWIGPVGIAVALAVAALVIARELRAIQFTDLIAGLAAVSAPRRLAAFGLSLLAYAALPGYDAIALRMIGRPLRWWRVMLSSTVAYAISQTLGFSLITGGSVRYRYWSGWGLTPAEIAAAMASVVTTFAVGLVAVGSTALILGPAGGGLGGRYSGFLVPIGWVGAGLIGGYLAACARRPGPIGIGSVRLVLPSLRLAGAQLVVAAVDWTLAAAVLAVLLPAGGPPFTIVLGAFLVAQLAGIVSHLPGGVAVFESIMVLLLRPAVPTAPLLGALIAFRVIYYLIPFAIGVVVLSVSEAVRGRARMAAAAKGGTRIAIRIARSLPAVLPYALGWAAFGAGAVLLISGVTPAIHARMAWLDRLLPLGVIEASHFIGSLVGVALVVLGRALARRLDAAYRLTQGLLLVGIAASLMKGLDWEESLLLAGLFLALLPARRHFMRKAALLDEPLSTRWVAATVAVVGFTIWLGLFAHRHVEYSHELWWQFSVHGDAPRYLRATVGAVTLLAAFGLARLFRIASVRTAAPSDAELTRVSEIVAREGTAMANLALLGDKTLLFSPSGRGFIMYRVAGRSWVAMGDPVGADRRELVWRFHAMARHHGGWTVFYEVSDCCLPLYLDLGLTLRKIGEEAFVELGDFSLEGSNRRGLRRTHRDLLKVGAAFAIEPATRVEALLPELREVSDDWLAAKQGREKSFSLGRFDPNYLTRTPIATVRIDGRLVAFANLWSARHSGDLSMDLMRYRPDAPAGVMTYLFIELMLWGRQEGYRAFSLGMAPLTGFESRAHAPLWNRFGAFLGQYGEAIYRFQGLRRYKEKFDPLWRPRYLASPSGLALPRVLADVTRLVSGGVGGLVRT